MKIPIFYFIQTDADKSYNAFVLDTEATNINDVKVKEIVTNFPLNSSGKSFHFRFQAVSDKEKTWVDITNLNARAPVVNNQIYVKVLPVPTNTSSKIFKKVFENNDTKVNSNGLSQPPPSQQETQNLLEEPPKFKATRIYQDYQTTNLMEGEFIKVTKTINVQTVSSNIGGFVEGNNISNTNANHANLMEFNPIETKPPTIPKLNSGTFDKPVPQNIGSSRLDLTHDQLTKLKEEESKKKQDTMVNDLRKKWDEEEKKKDEQITLQDELEPKIQKWSYKGKIRNNLRTLLYTLPDILWQDSGWDALDFSQLMDPAQITKHYRNALRRLHEDKITVDDPKSRYISKRICSELTEAYKEFNANNST